MHLEQLEDRCLLDGTVVFSKIFVPDTIGPGSVSTLRFDINNESDMPASDLAFVDMLPSGMTIADPSSASSSCGGTLSVADDGGTISLSGGMLGASQTCEISVNVTAGLGEVNIYDNVSGDLTSNLGNSGPASATLTVDTNRPGFSKSFSPDTISLGQTSTLTLTVDNTANQSDIFQLQFLDPLPGGMVIATPANASTDCSSVNAPASLTADSGTSSISLSAMGFANLEDPVLAGGATCTVSVDVTTETNGVFINATDELLSGTRSVSSGFATAAVEVPVTFLSKVFTDDPVPPGGTVNLQFTINNLDRSNPATSIAFSDTLDPLGSLTGVVPNEDLPKSVCGGTLDFTAGALDFSGGSLPEEGSCTFSIALAVPSTAPAGTYLNTTTAITATRDGEGVVGNVASDRLAVSNAPIFTKEFIDDPVGAGGQVTLRFTIRNPNVNSALNDLEFTDDLNTAIFGLAANILVSGGDPEPLVNPCGVGSELTVDDPAPQFLPPDPTQLIFSGGSLAAAGSPGDSCSFDVVLDVPSGIPGSIYINTTSELTGFFTEEVSNTTALPASGELVLVGAPRLTKEFTNNPVAPGGTANLQFTVSYGTDETVGDATDISFTDDLNATLSGLVATVLPADGLCGPGSQITGTDSLSFTGGNLTPGSSCTFSVTVAVPTGAAPGPHTNTTSNLTASVLGVATSALPAEDDLQVVGLTFTKEFTDDPVIPGDNVTLEFTIDNTTSLAVSSISFDDVLDSTVLTVVTLPTTPCGPGSTLTTFDPLGPPTEALRLSGGNLAADASCTFSVTLMVPGTAVSDSYLNTTTPLSANFGAGPVTLTAATDTLVVDGVLLGLTKEFIDDPVPQGGTVTLEFNFTNLATETVTSIAFMDDLDSALSGLEATGAISNTCGGMAISSFPTGLFFYEGGNLLAGESCTISLLVDVPGGAAPGVYTNTTGLVSGMIGNLTVSGDAASDDLEVIGPVEFSKAFDGPTTATGTPVLTFTITNTGPDAATGLAFSDNLDAVITGLVATNLPLSDVCGAGSLLSGTSSLMLSGGELGPMSSCTINVELLVPVTATAGTFPNTTSVLSQGGLTVAGPATANLIVEPPPTFAKSFAPDTIQAGEVSTLTFTIDNSASALAASDLSFIDNFPTGVVIADPTNASTTCAGGMGDASPGATSFSFAGGSVGAGASCTIKFDVTSVIPDTYVNTTGDLTTSSGNSGTATDTLTVTPIPPEFSKSFAPDSIEAGAVSTLTFTIDNSASSVAASDLSLVDNFPTGVVIADPTNASTTCAGGMGDASPGASSFSFADGSVGAGASCTIKFDVTSVLPGVYVNTADDLTSSSGNSGPASDTLTVTSLAPLFSKTFAPDTIAAGAVSTLTFTINNSASLVAASDLSFIDNLPVGVVIAGPTNASTTCAGGMGDASPGAISFSFAGGSVGAEASCTIRFDVTSVIPDTYVNTTGDLTSSSGNSGTATDTLTVTQPQPPTFSKSFAPNPIALNETSTLTFTIDNTVNAVPASSLDFTDNLPEGIVIAATPNASTDCTGGVLIAAAGSLVVDYSGGSVAAGASCTVQVDVTGASIGSHENISDNLTSSLGNSGSASDTLTVEALTFDKSFLPAVIGVGGTSTLTFEIVNLSSNSVSNLAFTDNLPSGVTIAAPANASSSCGGTITAPNGGSTIALSAGGVGPLGSCTATVDVTSSIADTYTNVTSLLQTSARNVQPATADLIVANDRPGFSKGFSPDSISRGARSTLTFTIDNGANERSSATELNFTDNLPAGIVIASPSNASTSCSGGVLTAVPGTDVISYTMGSVNALASCTVSVDVIGTAVGLLGNTSGELTSLISLGDEPETVSSGKASAVLEVIGDPLSLIKSFTDDPVPPGGTVNLEFVITNFSRDDSATNITFTDNLTATLSGLAAVGLPQSDVCGTGSTLSGTSLLTLSGASLGPGESCTFSTTLQVPAAAATGVYTNTTSSITGDVGGESVTGAPGSDDLFVQTAPILTKSFTNDPVGRGGAVNLHFNIQNTSTTFSAANIAFTDNLDAILPGLTAAMLPADGFCGAGSSLTSQLVSDLTTLVMTGGTLPAGGSCGFDVTLLVPAGAAGGSYTNTTSAIAAMVGAAPLTGNPASDDLVVVGSPRLRKEFTNNPVLPGANANLQFTLIYDGEGAAGDDATNINFTDNLSAALAGLSAVGLPINDICGTGSQLSGTTNLSFTGGSLTPESTCTFNVSVFVPLASLPGSFTNETSNLTATVDGVTTMNVPATDDLQVAGLSISKEFTNDPVPAGGTVTLQFKIDNVSQVANATNITFTDNLDNTLAGLVALPPLDAGTCDGTLSGTSTLMYSGGSLAAGESCTFSATLQVPASAASDAYVNTTSNLDALFGTTPVSLDPATDTLIVASGLLLLDKNFVEDSALPGDTVTLDFTITNLDASQSVTGITFTDDLDAALAGLAAVGLPSSGVCGAGSQLAGTSLLTLTGAALGPGASCSFSTTLQLPENISFGSIVSNTTSQATGDLGGLQVTGDPASDELQIDFFRFSKSFDGITSPGGAPKLTFTIENLAETAVNGVSFSDDLTAVIPGLAAIGLPASGVCGAGSQLAGTSLLTFTGGNLGPGGSCTFDVTLQVPASAAAGTFTNVTSDLLLGGTSAAGPAVDSLTVVPPPDFDKTFTPAGIPLTGTSTLSFSINNSTSPLGATALTFTDNLPAGVTVAVPPNASTTCTGGILTAAAGSSVITYSGGAVAAGASCSAQVDVTSVLSGSHLNVSGDLTSSLGNSGPASATLISQIMLMGGPFTPGVNFLTTSNGLSDAIAILVKGTQPGSKTLTVQGVTFTTAFADPVVVAFAETDVDGSATFVLFATEAQVGQTLQYQAVQILPILDVSAVLSVPVVDAPLLAAGGQAVLAHGESAGATQLTPAMLRSVVAQAIERWEGMGLTQAEIDLLHSTTVRIADLSAGLLGQLVGTTISIDYSAADHGWFVDGALGDDEEFGATLSQTESGANAGGPADQRMDLFTAVLHEFGHVLKFEDTSPNQSLRGVMTAELPTSVRRLPTRWQNPSHILDVNDDGSVSPLDGLLIINEMNESQFRDADGRLPNSVPERGLRRFLDTNGDGFATALDVLRIINHLNGFNAVAEGEAPQHVFDLALLGLQTEQPPATAPVPRQTVSVDNTDRDAQSLVVQSVSSNRTKESDFSLAASESAPADSDLALLEWLEQQSSRAE